VIPARRSAIAMHSPDMPAPMIPTRGDLNDVVVEPSPGLPNSTSYSFVDRGGTRGTSGNAGAQHPLVVYRIAEASLGGERAAREQVHVMFPGVCNTAEYLHRPLGDLTDDPRRVRLGDRARLASVFETVVNGSSGVQDCRPGRLLKNMTLREEMLQRLEGADYFSILLSLARVRDCHVQTPRSGSEAFSRAYHRPDLKSRQQCFHGLRTGKDVLRSDRNPGKTHRACTAARVERPLGLNLHSGGIAWNEEHDGAVVGENCDCESSGTLRVVDVEFRSVHNVAVSVKRSGFDAVEVPRAS